MDRFDLVHSFAKAIVQCRAVTLLRDVTESGRSVNRKERTLSTRNSPQVIHKRNDEVLQDAPRHVDRASLEIDGRRLELINNKSRSPFQ